MATLADQVLGAIYEEALSHANPVLTIEMLKGNPALASLSDRELAAGITVLMDRGTLRRKRMAVTYESVAIEHRAMVHLLTENYPGFGAMVRDVALSLRDAAPDTGIAVGVDLSSDELAARIGQSEFPVRYALHFLNDQGSIKVSEAGTNREFQKISGVQVWNSKLDAFIYDLGA